MNLDAKDDSEFRYGSASSRKQAEKINKIAQRSVLNHTLTTDRNGEASDAQFKNLPYVFDSVPETVEELDELLGTHTIPEQSVIIKRLLTCFHPSLEEGANTEPISALVVLLLKKVEKSSSQLEVNMLYKALFSITHELARSKNNSNASATILLLSTHPLLKMLADYIIAIEQSIYQKGAPRYPSNGKIISLTCLLRLFSSSDYQHCVVTPILIFFCECLSQIPLLTCSDVLRGVFICSVLVNICVESTASGLRLFGEIQRFLSSVLALVTDSIRKQIREQEKEDESKDEDAEDDADDDDDDEDEEEDDGDESKFLFNFPPLIATKTFSIKGTASPLETEAKFLQITTNNQNDEPKKLPLPNMCKPEETVSPVSILFSVVELLQQFNFYCENVGERTADSLASPYHSAAVKSFGLQHETRYLLNEILLLEELHPRIASMIQTIVNTEERGNYKKKTVAELLNPKTVVKANDAESEAWSFTTIKRKNPKILKQEDPETKDIDTKRLPGQAVFLTPEEEKEQRKDLQRRLQKEKRSAMRELRKDTQYISSLRRQELAKEHEEISKKGRQIMAVLEQQQHDGKTASLEKERRKRKSGLKM
jgi:hypothetical protein